VVVPAVSLRAMTGLECPFCGSLRALHALLHGAPQLAFTLNPLTTVGAALIVGASVHDVVRPTRAIAVARVVTLSFSTRGVVLAAVFGVLRDVFSAAGWMVR